jgi:hypothetical protein
MATKSTPPKGRSQPRYQWFGCWLGRQDSNLGMAESKSDQLALSLNAASKKLAKFTPNTANRLARISERGALFSARATSAFASCGLTAALALVG